MLVPECHPDQALVRTALQGDPKALRELVSRLTPVVQARVAQLLLRWGAGRSRSVRQEVADITQEVFVALFAVDGRALRAWEPEAGANLEAFVSLVAHRQAISVLRSRRRSPVQVHMAASHDLDSAIADVSPADATLAAKADVVRIADGLRSRLSSKGFEMFYALFILEETVSELAERTGQSVTAVYQWRSRIKKLILNLAAEYSAAPGDEGAGSAGYEQNNATKQSMGRRPE